MQFPVNLLLQIKKTKVTLKAFSKGCRWVLINTFFSWAFLYNAYLDTYWPAWAAVLMINAGLFIYSVFYLSPWEAEMDERDAAAVKDFRQRLEASAGELGTDVSSSADARRTRVKFTRAGTVFESEIKSVSHEGRATGTVFSVAFPFPAPARRWFYIGRKSRRNWRRWFYPQFCENLSDEFEFFGSDEQFVVSVAANDLIIAHLTRYIINKGNLIEVDFKKGKFKIACSLGGRTDYWLRAEDSGKLNQTAVLFYESIKTVGR